MIAIFGFVASYVCQFEVIKISQIYTNLNNFSVSGLEDNQLEKTQSYHVMLCYVEFIYRQ